MPWFRSSLAKANETVRWADQEITDQLGPPEQMNGYGVSGSLDHHHTHPVEPVRVRCG